MSCVIVVLDGSRVVVVVDGMSCVVVILDGSRVIVVVDGMSCVVVVLDGSRVVVDGMSCVIDSIFGVAVTKVVEVFMVGAAWQSDSTTNIKTKAFILEYMLLDCFKIVYVFCMYIYVLFYDS